MKLNNQCNKNPNALKQAANVVWFAGLRCYFFALLLVLPLVSADKAEARFCWDLDETGCSFTANDTSDEYYYTISDKEINDRKANNGGQNHKFRMRPECDEEDDDDGCDGDQEFRLQLVSYQYIGTLQQTPTLGDKNSADIELHFRKGDTDETDDWSVGEFLDGELEEEKGFYTKYGYFKLEFNKDFVDQLSAGSHQFIFSVEGDSGDGKKQTLRYIFETEIQNLVQITGLEDTPMGTFPNHQTYFQQNFCVYATGDGRGGGGQFGLYGTSKNPNFNFELKRIGQNTPAIAYIAKVGAGADAPEGSLKRINSVVVGIEFTGSSSINCGGSENMTLRIELDATFQELSVLPAGTYSDVLTLVVEAK